MVAWRAINGDVIRCKKAAVMSFQLIIPYLEELRRCNPSSLIGYSRDQNCNMVDLHFFIPFANDVLKTARPVVALDAAHLRSEYKGVLYIASVLSGGKDIYPIGFMISMGNEDGPTWTKMLKLLKEACPIICEQGVDPRVNQDRHEEENANDEKVAVNAAKKRGANNATAKDEKANANASKKRGVKNATAKDKKANANAAKKRGTNNNTTAKDEKTNANAAKNEDSTTDDTNQKDDVLLYRILHNSKVDSFEDLLDVAPFIEEYETLSGNRLRIQQSVIDKFRLYRCCSHVQCPFRLQFSRKGHVDGRFVLSSTNPKHSTVPQSNRAVDGRKLKKRRQGEMLDEIITRVQKTKDGLPVPADVIKTATNT